MAGAVARRASSPRGVDDTAEDSNIRCAEADPWPDDLRTDNVHVPEREQVNREVLGNGRQGACDRLNWRIRGELGVVGVEELRQAEAFLQ